ncbi:formimidoylglutamase [Balneola sp. MJW-20]|uniref:formimidoylglutamase n=1 Tax=Gracilimonas aurantiaca TaxID=3234185 RepID=UPI003465FAF0
MDKQFYRQTDKDVWSGRVDDKDDTDQFRLHQVVDCRSLMDNEPVSERVMIGFASDEGVKRNQGRVGAKEGPDHLRKNVSSISWHEPRHRVTDLGNILVANDELERAQKYLGQTIHKLLLKGKQLIVIGGGHETAFGHYLGVADFLREKHLSAKLGIVNIDAHFDLRPVGEAGHSGSPFLQAHEHAAASGMDLKYFVYGINKDNNTASLFRKAEDLDVQYCSNREVLEREGASLQKLKEFMDGRSHIYLTICLDVFDASIAPGVSAPAWNGIGLRHSQKVIDLIRSENKLVSADICELNPVYDIDNRTARTAGTLFSQLIR